MLAGKLGMLEGKVTTSNTGAFNVSSYCWKKWLLDAAVPHQKVEVFGHTWDGKYASYIERTLRPTRVRFEEQVPLGAPASLADSPVLPLSPGGNASSVDPFGRIMSLWYSRMRAMELVHAYERETGRRFDLVHLVRWDFCYCRDGREGIRYRPLPPGKLLAITPLNLCVLRADKGYLGRVGGVDPPFHCSPRFEDPACAPRPRAPELGGRRASLARAHTHTLTHGRVCVSRARHTVSGMRRVCAVIASPHTLAGHACHLYLCVPAGMGRTWRRSVAARLRRTAPASPRLGRWPVWGANSERARAAWRALRELRRAL